MLEFIELWYKLKQKKRVYKSILNDLDEDGDLWAAINSSFDGVQWGRGGAASAGVFPYEGTNNAKYCTLGIPFNQHQGKK